MGGLTGYTPIENIPHTFVLLNVVFNQDEKGRLKYVQFVTKNLKSRRVLRDKDIVAINAWEYILVKELEKNVQYVKKNIFLNFRYGINLNIVPRNVLELVKNKGREKGMEKIRLAKFVENNFIVTQHM